MRRVFSSLSSNATRGGYKFCPCLSRAFPRTNVLPTTRQQVSESQFEAGFSANVKGVFFRMQRALPLMPDGAAVVLNASMWTIKGIPGFGVLSASKAAVRSFAAVGKRTQGEADMHERRQPRPGTHSIA